MNTKYESIMNELADKYKIQGITTDVEELEKTTTFTMILNLGVNRYIRPCEVLNLDITDEYIKDIAEQQIERARWFQK